MDSFKRCPVIGLDIETKDPNLKTKGMGGRRGDGFIVGVDIARSETDAKYYPVAHKMRNMENPEQFWNHLRHEAAQYEGEIIGARLQYDLDWLDAEQGVVFPKATIRDVQGAEALLDENAFTYNLERLANDYLGHGKESLGLKELYGDDYIKNMDLVDPGHAEDYANGDTIYAMQVYKKQLVGLEAQDLMRVWEVECGLHPVLVQMRQSGVRVNLQRARDAVDQCEVEEAAMEKRIAELTGGVIPIWSAQSIAIGFDRLGITYPRTAPSERNPDGNPSFTKPWLEAHPSEFAKCLVNQRSYEKIRGTFLENYILGAAVPEAGDMIGRIFAEFNALRSDDRGAVSGRFSSSSPNLQNIPVRHDVLGPLLRSVFIPEEGMDWGCADWSQIEYRLLVHFASKMPGIDGSAFRALKMYQNDPTTDFHAMAAKLTGKPRKEAKSINFGVVYGMGLVTMAANLGLPVEQAKPILEGFHEEMPFLKQMLDKASTRAANRGYIKTILGRRRRFEGYETGWGDHRRYFQTLADAHAAIAAGEASGYPKRAGTHKTLNALLQGSNADFMKKAMVDIHRAGIFNVLVPHITVHDELNVSVPRTKEAKEAFGEMTELMVNAFELNVPVLVDANIGSDWNDAK
jgi:DNA polymerase I-like protein with 3'-5' exonuclease and polymerase domains